MTSGPRLFRSMLPPPVRLSIPVGHHRGGRNRLPAQYRFACNRSSGSPRFSGVSSRHGPRDPLRQGRPRERRHRACARRPRARAVVRLAARPPARNARLAALLERDDRGLAPRQRAPGPASASDADLTAAVLDDLHTTARRGVRRERGPAERRRAPRRAHDLLRVHRRRTHPRERRGGGRRPRPAARHHVPRRARRLAGTGCADAPTPRAARSSGTGRRTGRAGGARWDRAATRRRSARTASGPAALCTEPILLPLRGPAGEPVDLWRTLILARLRGAAADGARRDATHARPHRAAAPRSGRAASDRRRRARPRGRPGSSAARRPRPRPARRSAAAAAHVLHLDQDLSAFYATARRRPELAWVTAGAGRMLRSPTVFEDVVKTICTTNCTWALTTRDGERARDASRRARGRGSPERPAPRTPSPRRSRWRPRRELLPGGRPRRLPGASLRRAGDARWPRARSTSRRWATASREELPDDEVERQLLALPGVGPYAAAHIMMTLGRNSRLILDSWTRPTYARLVGAHRPADADDRAPVPPLRGGGGARVLAVRHPRLGGLRWSRCARPGVAPPRGAAGHTARGPFGPSRADRRAKEVSP